MKTKSKILRSRLAGLMVLLRRSRLADLNLTLIGFGLPVCGGQMTIRCRNIRHIL